MIGEAIVAGDPTVFDLCSGELLALSASDRAGEGLVKRIVLALLSVLSAAK